MGTHVESISREWKYRYKRKTYKEVGMAVQKGEYRPTREVHHTHEGSIGNLCTAEIRQKMERVLEEFE